MSTRTIALPDELASYLDAQVASGRFPDSSECVRELLENDRLGAVRQDIENRLIRSIRSDEVEMKPADWDALRREGDRILLERRKQ